MSHVPPSFLRRVTVTIDAEEKTLTAEACIGDRCFTKSVDLEPLTHFIAEQLAAYHASLHPGTDAIAGLGSFLSRAKDTAKRIASSSAVKTLYKQALPIAASAIPGGSTALAVAQSTYSVVKDAKKGNPKAIATLQKTVDKANAGDPLAKQVLDTAKKLSTLHDLKASKDAPDMAHRLARIEQSLHPLVKFSGYSISADDEFIPDDGDDFDIWREREDIVAGRFTNALRYTPLGLAARYSPPALAYRGAKKLLTKKPTRRALKDHRARGHAPMPPRVMAPKPSSAMAAPFSNTSTIEISEPDEMAYDGGDGAGTFDITLPGEGVMDGEGYGDEAIGGWREWAYSRPFRSPVAAALQGDYGASATLRGAYAGGLGILLSRGR